MTQNRITRVIATTAVAVTICLGVLAQPASAGLISSSGSIGYVGLPTGICRHYSSWNRLDVQVYPPEIYAPNLTAGWGNDAAWTRYQLQVIDRYGRVVNTSSASGWAASYDNRAAAFSGSPTTFYNIPEFSTVRVLVEWYGARHSTAQYRLDKYVLYTGGTGPYGGLNSCSKWR